MYVIAGLGNPGMKYSGTRHNAGFEALDLIAKKNGITIRKNEFRALTGTGVMEGEKVLLMKPQTFMNLSGEAIGPLCAYYGVDPSTNLIVLSDDIALPAGKIRIRAKGSAGGHNGLKDIIANCHTDAFKRIRIGMGVFQNGDDMVSFVLGKPPKTDRALIEDAFDRAEQAVHVIITDGVEAAMNKFN
jgi:PTH1 family peptidyl-tRNA hydrolase